MPKSAAEGLRERALVKLASEEAKEERRLRALVVVKSKIDDVDDIADDERETEEQVDILFY